MFESVDLMSQVLALTSLGYVGPGLSAGTLGLILGVLGAVALAILGVFYYPIKRMMKGRKSKAAHTKASQPEAQSSQEESQQ